jgi:hypothetical protein
MRSRSLRGLRRFSQIALHACEVIWNAAIRCVVLGVRCSILRSLPRRSFSEGGFHSPAHLRLFLFTLSNSVNLCRLFNLLERQVKIGQEKDQSSSSGKTRSGRKMVGDEWVVVRNQAAPLIRTLWSLRGPTPKHGHYFPKKGTQTYAHMETNYPRSPHIMDRTGTDLRPNGLLAAQGPWRALRSLLSAARSIAHHQ